MATKRKPAQPEVPWGDHGEEVVEPGIGDGFVAWDGHGDNIRGKLLPRWRSRAMRSPAVTIELTHVPTVPIFNTEDGKDPILMTCVPGDKVNVSLSHDLDRKLSRNLEGHEVGVLYVGDQATPKGSMRVFRVFTLEDPDRDF